MQLKINNMKRYIEIVYDNSGSMNERINDRYKYEVAQELFEQVLLPLIGLPGDEIALRLLANHCETDSSNAISLTGLYGNDKPRILQHIKSITHSGHTPLVYTICDSINTCKKTKYDQHCIFVLTDGDDTCSVNIYDLISKDDFHKYVKFYQVLMAQLAVKSSVSRNNLKAIAEQIGGVSVVLNGEDDIASMKEKLKKGLSLSGINNQFPLDYCFEKLPGLDLSWDDIHNLGIEYNQAYLMYDKKFLSWKPDLNKLVSQLQLAELKFLYALKFKTDLPQNLIKSMLTQLKKPYYYSHDCIYWDFSNARWKYFRKGTSFEQIKNPDAIIEDGSNHFIENNKMNKKNLQIFTQQVYRVEDNQMSTLPSFILNPLGDTDWTKVLKVGDQVKFINN